MKKLFVGVVLASLCAIPGPSRAEARSEPRDVAAPAPDPRAGRAPEGDSGEAGTRATDLEEREKAAPELGEFSGGADGVYITSGAIIVAQLVVLLLVAL